MKPRVYINFADQVSVHVARTKARSDALLGRPVSAVIAWICSPAWFVCPWGERRDVRGTIYYSLPDRAGTGFILINDGDTVEGEIVSVDEGRG